MARAVRVASGRVSASAGTFVLTEGAGPRTSRARTFSEFISWKRVPKSLTSPYDENRVHRTPCTRPSPPSIGDPRTPRIMMSKRARGWRELGLSAASLIVSVAVLEVLLRVFGFSWPVLWQSDPNRGSARPPGARWVQENEGRATIQINRHGFRSKEVDAEKPPGTLRIAVLGDSYTEALQVPTEERFTEVAETELVRQLHRDVEVLNFGMEGYGTAQELMTFRHHVQQYRPDVVVLQFFAANDVRNNSKSLEGDPARPYFRLRGGQLELDTSYQDYNQSWLRRWGVSLSYRLRVAQLAYAVFRRMRAQSRMREADSDKEVASSNALLPLNAGLDEEIYRPPRDPVWREAWLVTEGLIAQLYRETVAAGSRFLLVAVPHAVEIHPDAVVRSEFVTKVGRHDLSYADRRLRQLARRLGVRALILSEELQRYATATGRPLCGFENTRLGWGHFNAEGHRVAGRLVARAIMRLLAEQSAELGPKLRTGRIIPSTP
jgi:hypothetical protein